MPFKNEIVWRRSASVGHYKMMSNSFALNHDTIFFYTKTTKFTFNKQFIRDTKEQMEKFIKEARDDNDGRGPYGWQPMVSPSEKTIERMKKEGNFKAAGDGNKSKYHGYKVYLSNRKGRPVETIWSDVPGFSSMSKEREKS